MCLALLTDKNLAPARACVGRYAWFCRATLTGKGRAPNTEQGVLSHAGPLGPAPAERAIHSHCGTGNGRAPGAHGSKARTGPSPHRPSLLRVLGQTAGRQAGPHEPTTTHRSAAHQLDREGIRDNTPRVTRTAVGQPRATGEDGTLQSSHCPAGSREPQGPIDTATIGSKQGRQ
jgi:hypothetical protein